MKQKSSDIPDKIWSEHKKAKQKTVEVFGGLLWGVKRHFVKVLVDAGYEYDTDKNWDSQLSEILFH